MGQKVVMVGQETSYDVEHGWYGWPPCIEPGGIYTIRDVDTRAAEYGWPIVLRFEEFIIKPLPVPDSPELGLWECGFPGDCFRPVVERSTDISALQALLLPNAKVLEGA
ncbi:MAG TPA: hypothetical protein VNU68_22440 [Verrucomicrobiae bacterium]|nr:hypothetical protein [Verrucomicrobiae bacterium]